MNRIKEILEKKGIKQKWLAIQLSKTSVTISSYVQNRSQPSLGTLFKIAKLLNVKPCDLINEDF